MKGLWITLGLLVAARVFGGDIVTVKLDEVSPRGTYTNIWFECKFTIHNASNTPLSTTSLFVAPPGLALKVSGLDGNELKRLYANPWINEALNNPLIPPGDSAFKELYGLGGWHSHPFPLPESMQVVRVQLEGTLSGSGYTNRVTSNVVEVHVP
jgi:hypothetical protein